ncbi:unnamed protein product [Orchesella dallaii]|uniref:Uncharacterized protein n=1 Tax=Orchesella dallaii TaxID=48710 RepID=A0ABP1QUL9_9HEXA
MLLQRSSKVPKVDAIIALGHFETSLNFNTSKFQDVAVRFFEIAGHFRLIPAKLHTSQSTHVTKMRWPDVGAILVANMAILSLEAIHLTLSFSLNQVAKSFTKLVNSIPTSESPSESTATALKVYYELRDISQNIKEAMGYCTLALLLEFVMFFVGSYCKILLIWKLSIVAFATMFMVIIAIILFLSADAHNQMLATSCTYLITMNQLDTPK